MTSEQIVKPGGDGFSYGHANLLALLHDQRA
jgi:hypothetical protein